MVMSAVTFASGLEGAFSAFKNGVGARALAMGGAFVAVCDDATAMVWNPAGLAQLDDTRLTAMSVDLLGFGANHRFVGLTTSFANLGIGLGWESMSASGDVLDFDGTILGSIKQSDNVIIGSLATNVLDVAMAGANVKYYMSTLGENEAQGFGFDLGLLVSLGDTFVIGVNAIDLGGSAITWESDAADTVTGLYKAGVAMKLADGRFVLAADVDFDGVNPGDTHVGMEFKVIDELALRGGVVLVDSSFTNYYLTVGAGINVAGLYVDAAYLLNDTLELGADTHMLVLSAEFSLGALLGEDEPDVEPVGTE